MIPTVENLHFLSSISWDVKEPQCDPAAADASL